ncbi:MAG: UDP-N-acetylmuramate dehydrogenase [Spirochaetaceae bacterium]|nr:MAG: UDP-N-acetylmuramate dehydrogenase [Spirochaetaceae bacterium]
MKTFRELFEKSRIPAFYDEPMKNHTSFKIGGPADIYVLVHTPSEIPDLQLFCRKHDIPIFVLGAGANILVGDRGIRGVVLSLEAVGEIHIAENILSAGAGASISNAAKRAAAAGLGGIENFYSMPGSIGGSVWMNARCYDVSVSDTLDEVGVIDSLMNFSNKKMDSKFFGYKTSPFQSSGEIIIRASFKLSKGDPMVLENRMSQCEQDRKSKGHFSHPSAGSVFKNNRAFGEPAGKIIDSLGLRGYGIGGARISPLHANIIINEGNATADEVRRLIEHIRDRVRKDLGFELEPEVLYVGEF